MGLFGSRKKLDDGLKKTRVGFWGNLWNSISGSVIDDDMYDDLEEQLILADTGADTAIKLVDDLRDKVRAEHLKTGEQAMQALKEIIQQELTAEKEFDLSGHPAVILVIGVNGVV